MAEALTDPARCRDGNRLAALRILCGYCRARSARIRSKSRARQIRESAAHRTAAGNDGRRARALRTVFRLARLVGPRQTTVLITGETGTGKELVARGIHRNQPARERARLWWSIARPSPSSCWKPNCLATRAGPLPGAVQSRLGRIHVAHGGTLFLDEVGELPLSMQAKLLRFLQDGEVQRLGSSDVFRVDVRVISATNINLRRSVQEKQFRQDLYYRLAVFPLELPPLRQRKEGHRSAGRAFSGRVCASRPEFRPRALSLSAAALLRQYSWPGNVRELQHAVERAFILAENERQLRAAHFQSAGARPRS